MRELVGRVYAALVFGGADQWVHRCCQFADQAGVSCLVVRLVDSRLHLMEQLVSGPCVSKLPARASVEPSAGDTPEQFAARLGAIDSWKLKRRPWLTVRAKLNVRRLTFLADETARGSRVLSLKVEHYLGMKPLTIASQSYLNWATRRLT